MNKKIIIGIILVALFAIAGYYFFNKENREGKEQLFEIGVVAPLSGENATYGDILRKGFDLAFANEKLYKLKYEDSKFDPKTAVTVFQKLISIDNIQVVLGEVASGNTMAMVPVAEKNKVVLFSSISSADGLQKAGDYFFRNIPRNDVQGKTVATFIFNELKIDKVALFGLNDDYGINISKSFKNTFIELGGEIVFEDKHHKGQKDFRTSLIKIKDSGAKALFIPGDKNEPAIILKQAKELAMNIPILGGDGSSNDDVIQVAGNSAEGFYCSNVLVDKTSTYYKKYYKLFVNKYNKEPGAYDAYAYEAAMIILETVKHVGNNSEKIKNHLYTNSFESMTGKLKFDKDGEVNRLWGMYQVKNGKFTEIN